MKSALGIEPGEVLAGRYRILKGLGRGSTGEGFLAHDELLASDVVCKIGLTSDPSTWDAFKAQLAKLRRIRSRDVVQAHDMFALPVQDALHPVLVLEAVEGRELESWQQHASVPDRILTCSRVASALALLHAEAMSHGDLWKGVNILASADRVVLIDPDPELWGPTSGNGERRGDLEALASVIETMVPDLARLGLAKLVAELRRTRTDCTAAFAAEQLRAALTRIPLSDRAGLEQAARLYHAKHDAVDTLFKSIRLGRTLAIEGLADRLRAMCEPFQIVVTVEPAAVHDLEARFDLGGSATFQKRIITCSAKRQKLQWVFKFKEAENFYKPWPYIDAIPGIGRSIAFGTVWIIGSGSSETHRVQVCGDGSVFDLFARVITPPKRAGRFQRPVAEGSAAWERVSDEWLTRELARLTETGEYAP